MFPSSRVPEFPNAEFWKPLLNLIAATAYMGAMADATITRMLLISILTCCIISTAYGSLEQYIPALGERGNANRDELVERYFHLGLQQVDKKKAKLPSLLPLCLLLQYNCKNNFVGLPRSTESYGCLK